MPKLVKLETDANVSNYTPEAGNITTFFTAEDGAVKLKYKNSAGEIAELSGGGGGGGGGAFDLVKVTEYTPYQAAFSGITKVTFSGFGYDEMSGMDYSEFNGDWTVENPNEPDPLKRTFKLNDRYLYYFPDPEYRVGGDAWCIGSNKNYGGYEATLYYNSTSELSNGTINWYAMMGSATTQCTVTKASYPEVALVLKGQKATAYDPGTKVWTFADSVSSFTGAEKTVGKLGVYASIGTMLIGNKIATAAGPVPSGAIFYAPLESSQSKAETGQSLQNDGSVTFTGEYMSVNGDGKVTFNAGSSASVGTNPATMSIWYKGSDVTGGDGLCLLSYGSTPSGNTALTIKMISGVPYATGWGGGAAQVSSNVNIADSKWHHIAITYTNNTGKIYIDGELKGSGACSVNIGSDRSGAIGGAFWGNYSMCKGDFRAARIYNKVLSDEEIMALAGEF